MNTEIFFLVKIKLELIETRQGLKISCLEEIAYTKGWISTHRLIQLAEPVKQNKYSQHLFD